MRDFHSRFSLLNNIYWVFISCLLCSQAMVFAPPRCVIKNINNCIKPNTTASRIMGFQDFKCLDEKISASRKECQEESFFDWEIQEDLLETGSCFLLRRPISWIVWMRVQPLGFHFYI